MMPVVTGVRPWPKGPSQLGAFWSVSCALVRFASGTPTHDAPYAMRAREREEGEEAGQHVREEVSADEAGGTHPGGR